MLVFKKGDWKYHLYKPGLELNKLNLIGIKCNMEKSFFSQTEIKYLELLVTHKVISTVSKKVESIVNIKSPSKNKIICLFIVLFNHY